MKTKITALLTVMAMTVSAVMPYAYAANDAGSGVWMPNPLRVAEKLDRGLAAMKTPEGIYLSWRLFADEDSVYGTADGNVSFDIYRDGEKIAVESDTTNYVDTDGNENSVYRVVASGGDMSECREVTAFESGANYFDIPLKVPADVTAANGLVLSYSPGDASCGDLDGDGEYEVVLKWDAGPQDNSNSGYTGNVLLDAYKLDGTFLWRIDLGKNIRAGAHYTQFLVYDFDKDGRAEITAKTAPGSKDGKGSYVTAASLDESIKGANNSAVYVNSSGYILDGPEYFTIFDGETGAALDTINYPVQRVSASVWGDDFGNRCDRYLADVAYLDGENPYAVYWRGYYFGKRGFGQRTGICGIGFNGKRLDVKYIFDTLSGQNGYTSGNENYVGQGNHNLSVADIDNDGKDEVLSGAMCVGENDDGKLGVHWTTLKGHGDALHIGDYDPTHDGYEFFVVHEDGGETKKKPDGTTVVLDFGMSVIDPANGEIMYHKSANDDTGRGIMANVGAGGYYQFWSSGTGAYKATGDGGFESVSVPDASYNFRIFWDGDLYDELLDGTNISVWNGSGMSNIFSAGECTSVNGTKSNPALQADLFGDWREEVVYPLKNGSALRVYTTDIYTPHKMKTLMSDSVYRSGVAAEQSAYNQPPHIGYYTDAEYAPTPTPLPEGLTRKTLYERGYETAWTEADRAEWGATELTEEYGLRQTGGNGSNSAKITIDPEKNSIIHIEAYWVGMSHTGRYFYNGNCSYFKFGNIWIAQNDQDQSSAYSLSPFSSTHFTKFAGPNGYRDYDIASKNWYVIDMEIDTSTNILKSMTVKSSADPNKSLLTISDRKLSGYDYRNIEFGYLKGGSVGASNPNNEYLKKIKVEQITGEAVKPTPTVKPTPDAFERETVYERGYETAWTEADRAEWGATELTEEYGLWQTGGNESNSAKITIDPEENAVLAIEAYWIGMSNLNRRLNEGNCSYFKFGNIWIMQNDQSQASAYSLSPFSSENFTTFTGPNGYRDYDVSTKNWYVINMEIDTSSNILKSMTVKSSADPDKNLLEISDEELSEYDYNNIEFGYFKSGKVSTENNEYLKKIKVEKITEKPAEPTLAPLEVISAPAADVPSGEVDYGTKVTVSSTNEFYLGYNINGGDNVFPWLSSVTITITEDTVIDAWSAVDVFKPGVEYDIRHGTFTYTVKKDTIPTSSPTAVPSESPTVPPTIIPSESPTAPPTIIPSEGPTAPPTVIPSEGPTAPPTVQPTILPSESPSITDITPIGNYNGKVKIKKEINGNEIMLTVIAEETVVSEVMLFAAKYGDGGELIGVKAVKGENNNGIITVKTEIPDADSFRIMLWDKTNRPVTAPLDKNKLDKKSD